ncbi:MULTISPECIES: nitrous oxide reductase accessory protein NosL [Mesoflavibacter]|jgi:copper chaperone NosL|uniref:nitrous oxide reductase accessory protein NosL n=1 Tax=Mesoflavibacter TaxID=444051 RepID=UPI0004101B95|nr:MULTISPECIES: nitrous oxide reductase accessory protein NosL [Mesoflavibacter]UAB74131.1 nitrous oxide reductase accessory protein NosL [Mesoflavibacter sp. SCSIO 43206]
MKTLKHYIFISLLLLVFSCNVSPKPIDYGSDGCHFCKMTIVDKVHAAEIVTKKGKVYMFDATECMINFRKDFDTSEIELYLSNNYTEPEALIDATEATFLISKNIPSPMGAFLSAFKNEADAKEFQAEKGGDLYTWEELLAKFKD